MRPRTLGVIGTLVWDRFVDPTGRTEPLEGWGGISYALAALSASLPGGWSILPILKVGADLAEEGRRFLDTLPRVDTSALTVVPQANNRVELRYESPASRSERLVGGVPGWSWTELAAPIAACDALYVNFISGFEMDLETAREMARAFPGSRYGDLHSLFLDLDAAGRRIPRSLDDAWEWARCFHAIQLNEDELALAAGAGDPWSRAAAEVVTGPSLIAVTLGARGSACVAVAGFDADPLGWLGADSMDLARQVAGRDGAGRQDLGREDAGRQDHGRQDVRTTTVPTKARSGDPTGCGDVWGATFFARLLGGEGLRAAMTEANRLAGLNVDHRAAAGLVTQFVDAQ
jgi:sugar/nucleoside kinase (ribokinase family)